MPELDVENLRQWFLREKRELPWRESPTPYAVWVSEVMLQQTQVAVVIPYFERWMIRFPTIEHLAAATLDQVIKTWEGLGYYSRARNLHEGAKQVLTCFGGELPGTEEELASIKGLGPYTIGAIRAFAFHRRAAAVDGNVLRVLSRHFLIEESISKAKTVNHIRNLAEKLLPDHEPWVISEALIELGASHCSRKPVCSLCPLRGTCRAFATGQTALFPVKCPRKKTEILYRAVAVIRHRDALLVRREETGKIMSDLHEFPYFETSPEGIKESEFLEKIREHLNIEAHTLRPLGNGKHGFTHFDVRLRPLFMQTEKQSHIVGYRWLSFKELTDAAFSSGHRKIYDEIKLLFADS